MLLLLGCGAGATHTGARGTAAAPERPAAGDAPVPQGAFTLRGVGFDAPESALYDPDGDVYLVSNIVGSPVEADDLAFISRIRPDGNVEALRWIAAGEHGVKLHAPKGMALFEDTLYVTDITRVRKFDRRSGRPRGDIDVPGSSFLNDIAIDAQGNLYVSDSGLGQSLEPVGTDAIYRISSSRGVVSALARGPSLGQPNGVWATAAGVWIAGFGSGELYQLGASGERSSGRKPPGGSLYGIVEVDGRIVVSSWEGAAVYMLNPDGRFSALISGIETPADLGLDTKRRRLLIPLLNQNALVIHPL